MFSLSLRIIFAGVAVIGFFFLLKSISKMISIYNNPNRVIFPAMQRNVLFEIKETGMYEIAVMRPYLFGIIPSDISFQLSDDVNGLPVTVSKKLNLFSQRKNMSGERIVPVAEFEARQIGNFYLVNLNTDKFKECDRILITPKTGMRGFLLIFAILFSAILFIGGTVLTLISISKK